ncbi:MAG: homoserine dehydrogenase [Cyclobacteriaceae bacterium]|nr:homoserine dehydrogenase [Cyclobacteriaceae bacterium]
MDNIKIGLFGFGCVGQGFYDILQQQQLPMEIIGICVKDTSKPRTLPKDRFTFCPQDLLDNPDIDVIVELIDDAEEAFSIVKNALLQGKKVVTANKKMVAEHFEELLLLRNPQNALRYEAAVCGSIPIVNTVDSFYTGEPLHQISGIFNGSSNFILSKIEKEGISYQQALSLAQDLGFAETDPRLDVGGFDSLNKLVILLAHGFGVITTPQSLVNLGIHHLGEEDFAFARSRGLRIKLVARGALKNPGVRAYVMPAFVNNENPLWQVEEEYNGVLVQGAYSDSHLYTGKGAGSHPTAASVIADLHAVLKHQTYDYPKLSSGAGHFIDNKIKVPIYLRFRQPSQLEEFQFHKIWSEGRLKNGGFVLGTISLSHLWSLQDYADQQGIAIVDISSVQETISSLNGVLKKELVH